MKNYTYYDNLGRITNTRMLLNDEEADQNCFVGLSWIDGKYLSEEYCIENGHPISLPEKPDYPCHFDYTAKQWIWDEDKSWAGLRARRDKLLAACDWTQVPDAPVDQQAWAEYRQTLRDLPANTEDPRSPVWPTPPQ